MEPKNIVLNVNGIEVIYNHVILVLKGVSLQVPEGGIVAILGGNRIPFARSNTVYATATNQDMFTAALDGLVARFGLAGERLGEVAAGAVLKGWVESRFGLVPAFHRQRLQRFPSPAWVRYLLISVALLFLSLFLFVPLVSVFFEAFKKGVGSQDESQQAQPAQRAIRSTSGRPSGREKRACSNCRPRNASLGCGGTSMARAAICTSAPKPSETLPSAPSSCSTTGTPS